MIRPARAADIPAIHQLIQDLAEYEKALAQVTASEEDLRRALFGGRPAVFAHVAEAGGEIAGFALWFLNFSTWTGQHGIYLEDLYVRPDQRRSGLGRALLAELARICVARGYARLEWSVLDWNTPARDFYASLGAEEMDGWTVNRLAGPALRAMAGPVRGQDHDHPDAARPDRAVCGADPPAGPALPGLAGRGDAGPPAIADHR